MRFFIAALSLFIVANVAIAQDYQPMSFELDGNKFVANGVIDGDTLDAFEDIVDEHPDIKVLVLQQVDGSVDDEANVEFARIVRELEFTTIVPSDGLIASGGTDLFLAGVKRVLETGACVGVHSWGAEDFVATELPRSHEEHDRYLDYYDDVGVDEGFYWFTLEAAPADKMHWMSKGEVNKFNVATNDVGNLSASSACNTR